MTNNYKVTYNLYGQKYTKVRIPTIEAAKNEAHSFQALGASNVSITRMVD